MKQQRDSERKAVQEVAVLNVKNLDTTEVYFSRATVVDVSTTGLLLFVKRENILALSLRSNLTMAILHDVSVGFTIEIMDTYIEGVIKRTRLQGHGDFLVAVDFREDAPEYWRTALYELLPSNEGPFDPTGEDPDEEIEDEGEIDPIDDFDDQDQDEE